MCPPETPPLRVLLSPVPRWETITLGLLLALFVAVGLNAISNDAFKGQDYSFHVGCTNRLLGRPDAWFAQDATNRPLIYWIAIDGIFLTDNRAPFAFTAVVFLILNAGALGLLHDCSRRLIRSPVLRLSAVAFIALLPATVITSVVFAADGMATPPFVLLCWGLLRWSEETSVFPATIYAALAGLALVLGNFTKATFLVLPAGVLVVGVLAWRWRHVTRAHFLALVALGVCAPAVVGGWLHLAARAALADEPPWHRFTWTGTGEMTWRSLFGLKPGDIRIFDAPGYWDTAGGNGQKVLPLLAANSYSYPALLHLGIFTDVLDFAYRGSTDAGTPRPQPQKRFSQWAVRTGVVFSVAWVFAIVALIWRVRRAAHGPPQPPMFAATVCLVLGLTWFVPLVLTLPFIHHAYDWGYWLPRLILPSLWAFGLGFFCQIADLAGRKRLLISVVAGAVAVQCCLHLGSLWY